MAVNFTPSLRSFNTRLEQTSLGAISFFMIFAIVIVSLIFLWPSYVEFPMDDAYIHFMYAQNLAETGRLYFSVPDEVGVASSSLLWVLLLAGGYKLGLSMYVVSKVLGIASLATVGIGVFVLLDSVWPRWKSLTAGLLLSLSGNMLWFSLNGMETSLFLAFGVIALLLYRAGRWGWLGMILGLMILTRPEGMFLAVALGLMDLLARRRLTRDLVLTAALTILICAPWFLYLQWRTGDFLPTSAGAKQFTFFVAIDYMVDEYDLPEFIHQIPGMIYPLLWIVYLLQFGIGGISLPPPKLTVVGSAASLVVPLSIWAFPAAMLIIFLIAHSGKRFFSRSLWREWIRSTNMQIFLILFAWWILHNLVYMLMLPVLGTASRYGAVNYIVMWIAIVGGLGALNRKPRLQLAATIAIMFVGLCNTIYWNNVYDANIEHMINVRIAAANYVRDEMPDDTCAAFDIGAMRFYSRRPIVEIAALIDIEANRWASEGRVDEYLKNHEVTCLVLPGRPGYSTDGVYDLAAILKLDTSPMFDLEPVKVFAIDQERWLLGYLPTANYQASVAIYRLNYK